ncbi:amidase family protein [Spiribacter halobius]|nr:amidase family protein [Spiribacter halobius]UEX77659.1 amidase [Spiribacter halobius]
MRHAEKASIPSRYTVTRAGVIEMLAGRLQRGDVTPGDLLTRTLAMTREPALEAVFLELCEERADREARASAGRHRRGRPLGLLDGIPVAWKDLFDMAGLRTTAGSRLRLDSEPAREDAEAVQRLAAAGTVSVGKTNLSELAFSGLGLNPHFGTPANPWSTEQTRIPGGSSSGAAVAVATGAVPFAIGTDTSGSVRVPAAFTGLVGFKPTAGRYPQGGVYPLSRTLDRVGPLAPSVRDAFLLDQALRGRRPSSPATPALRGVRVVVPEDPVVDDADAEVRAVFTRAVEALREGGARISRMEMPSLQQARAAMRQYGSITAAEAYAFHRHALERTGRAVMDPLVVMRLYEGRNMSAADLATLHCVAGEAQRSLRHELAGALLLIPTVPCLAPLATPIAEDLDRAHRANRRVLANTVLGSFLDLPGVAIPCGLNAEHRLPVSCLLCGASGEDARVLATALAIEDALDDAGLWHSPAGRFLSEEL